MAPLPIAVARSRLKLNLGMLALIAFARTFFTPYLAVRAVLVAAVDTFASSPRSHPGDTGVWWIETLVTGIVLYNIAEAAYWIQHPTAPPVAKGMSFQPLQKSSPLTRSFNPIAPSPTTYRSSPLSKSVSAAASVSTPTPARGLSQSLSDYRVLTPLGQSTAGAEISTPLTQSLNLNLNSSTSTALNGSQGGLDYRGSPLRTAPFNTPKAPSATGLFFDDSSAASPSKVARAQQASASGVGAGTGVGGGVGAGIGGGVGGVSGATGVGAGQNLLGHSATRNAFVVVEREEREWVDNVWRGVKGKTRRLGL